MITSVSTKNMTREEWLELRKKTIGGSDASAIVGLNPYASQYSVWADKLGKLPEKETSEAMRLGTDLEPYVAERFAEVTGKKVRRRNAIFYNSDYPFASANIDREIIGENAGLECKTTSMLNLKKFKNGDYPPQYYVQCMHYMAVMGYDKMYLAVLILNQQFLVFEIERDEAEIHNLMELEAEFYKHIANGTPPPVDGAEPTTETLETIYKDTVDLTIELYDRNAELDRFIELKQEAARIKSEMEKVKQVIMEDMGENEAALCDDYRVTWKPQQRKTFDATRFFADNPELSGDGYYKCTTTRVFKITKTEKEI